MSVSINMSQEHDEHLHAGNKQPGWGLKFARAAYT